jgi:hypothetical protein
MNDSLRWGVLSTANIGRVAVNPAIRASSNGTLVAIASRDAERARVFADRHDIPRWHGSYEALLEDDGIDALYIPLPNSMHREWCLRAAEHGKHVLCEKPLALDAAECREMEDAARAAGTRLMEAFMYRFHPHTGNVLERIGPTLAFERAMIGAGGGGVGFPGAEPGAKAGALGRRCSEFTVPGAVVPKGRGSFVDFGFLLELARVLGRDRDPLVRQDLARLYILDEIARVTTLRGRALREVGREIPGLGNLAKLSKTGYVKLTRDAGMRIAGPAGTLHAYDDPAGQTALDDATGIPALAKLTDAVLFAQGSSIYGGTDEIQRNVVGEQVLGLPREPSNDRAVSFRDLPR